MHLRYPLSRLLLIPAASTALIAATPLVLDAAVSCGGPIAPKVVIISLYSDEETTWYGRDEINLLAQNISVPGVSPLFPEVHYTAAGDLCQLTLGEAEINAAVSMTAFTQSSLFDLRSKIGPFLLQWIITQSQSNENQSLT
jgi:purine nucleoside permease